eukprot:TRINITY_DN1097_c0_g1_i1.p1 TRINITY_DN1097_c0_g1~~TRINITY_DN1097_c0_g1_i1.p1  ORF type:complete len:543 (+),score=203.46 TRINITY_DN1097_c0_g1_i1:49-1629(+)
MSTPKTIFALDGESLDDQSLLVLSQHPEKYEVVLAEQCWERIRESRKVIDDIIESGQVRYGINTGFGNFANVVIPRADICQLQKNLILSHAAGVGQPLSPTKTRTLLILRINVLSKGYSGIRPETVQQLLDALNAGCLSEVPEQGTVGASGDLAPLAHLASGLLGYGRMWDPSTGKIEEDASAVLKKHGLIPLDLHAKEGLSLINGTQFITGIGAEAAVRAAKLCQMADIIAAVSLEAMRGSRKPFHPEVHKARPHTGQILVAQRIDSLLNCPSEIHESHLCCTKVQDSYTLRCIPQVHGVTHDTIQFVRGILGIEMNSATDNPMVFPKIDEIISAGNFHGEYPAKACDYLTIAVQELANISERRIERLCNSSLSDLPAFLVKDGGLNSGFMIPHCTAAALTSESRTLCFPSSCDTISTSAAKEDHVSMGGWAARKALKVVENVEKVLAIELMLAVQGLDFSLPLRSTAPIEEIRLLVREKIPHWDTDRFVRPDIDAAVEIVTSGRLLKVANRYCALFDPMDTIRA